MDAFGRARHREIGEAGEAGIAESATVASIMSRLCAAALARYANPAAVKIPNPAMSMKLSDRPPWSSCGCWASSASAVAGPQVEHDGSDEQRGDAEPAVQRERTAADEGDLRRDQYEPAREHHACT